MYSPVRYGEKYLPWVALFVSFGGLFTGSNWKSYGWLIRKILDLLLDPATSLVSQCTISEGMLWARICKRFWNPEIDSEESIQLAYVAWRAGTTNYRVVVPARQAGNRFLGSLKGLQIRALSIWYTQRRKTQRDIRMFQRQLREEWGLVDPQSTYI